LWPPDADPDRSHGHSLSLLLNLETVARSLFRLQVSSPPRQQRPSLIASRYRVTSNKRRPLWRVLPRMPPASSRCPPCPGSEAASTRVCPVAPTPCSSCAMRCCVPMARTPVCPNRPLLAEHQRGHGAMYDALNHGRTDIGRLRWSLASLPLPPGV